MSYNGWTNYETWAAALWLNNDPGTQSFIDDAAQSYLDMYEGDRDAARADLAAEIDYLIENDEPDLGASLYSDLLGAAISAIDVMEIAELVIDDNYNEWKEYYEED